MKKLFVSIILGLLMSLSVATVTLADATFSDVWELCPDGAWKVKSPSGGYICNAWFCDDAVPANGNNVWYLLGYDGSMISAGLVQDGTGNYYSIETNHNGYYGMMRYVDGWYNCNGQQVYLQFNKNHDGGFGKVINADGLAKLKAIYGVTPFNVTGGLQYTSTF